MKCEQEFKTALADGTQTCQKDAIAIVGTLSDIHKHHLCREHAFEFVAFLAERIEKVKSWKSD